MANTFTKVLQKRHPTNTEGVFFKEVQQTVIDNNGKVKIRVIDKVYVIRYRDQNKERFITMGKHSQGIRVKYCKTKRGEFITMAKNGELPPQLKNKLKKEIVSLDSIAALHFKDKALHNRSNKRAMQVYNLHIQPLLGSKDIDTITVDEIKQLQQIKADQFSPKHVNNIMGELSVIFSYAIKNGITTVHPMKQIEKLKVDNKRERFLSKDEVKQLLDAVKDDEQLYTFILLALNTGARVGAICILKAKDIDITHGTISMLDEKNNERYTCYLYDKNLIELLKKRMSTIDKRYPILDDGLTHNNLADRIKRKAGKVLNDLFNDDHTETKDRAVVHTLRHTFASHLAINGTPILTIQKLMNHKDINQTMRYAKLAPDSGRDAVKGLYDG